MSGRPAGTISITPADAAKDQASMKADRARLNSLRTLGVRARRAQERRDAAYVDLREAVSAAIAEGMPEKRAAELAQVDRMTVRKWQGKR